MLQIVIRFCLFFSLQIIPTKITEFYKKQFIHTNILQCKISNLPLSYYTQDSKKELENCKL